MWGHLQREEQPHYEVKSGIAYRGWRWEMIGTNWWTSACMHMPQRRWFWEGAGIEWGKQYALEGVKLFVVGGDGANWIRSGTEEFGNAIFQLDGFHLSRACGRGYGGEIGEAIYDAIRSGPESFARALMSAAVPAETTTAHPGQGVRRIQPAGLEWTGATGYPTLPRTRGAWEPWNPTGTSSPRTE